MMTGRPRKYATAAEAREAARHQRREYYLNHRSTVSVHEYIAPPPPFHVIAERERALMAPRDLTGLLMGDPLPGRSALDRKRPQLVIHG